MSRDLPPHLRADEPTRAEEDAAATLRSLAAERDALQAELLASNDSPAWQANEELNHALHAARAGVPIRGVHDLRHTWASWAYAIKPDLVRLKEMGGWSSTNQCEVYAHLMPEGLEASIRRVWGLVGTRRIAKVSAA